MFELPGISTLKTVPIKPMTDMGTPGFVVVGGYLASNERNPNLIGERKYITASDILANVAIVAAGIHYFLNLVASPEWNVVPADDSADAQRYADFVKSCMDDMETSWHRTVRRSAMYRFYGFGIQEWTAKRRDDGQTGIARISPRPQYTIYQWDIDENGQVKGVIQLSPMTFRQIYIPRSKLIYLVDDALSDSPEGFGLLRHLAEPAERYQEYLRIEGSGFDRDLRGIPVGWAPRAEIAAAADAGTISKEQANTMLSGLASFVQMRAKGTATGLLLDSSVYDSRTDTGITPSSTKRWGIELLTGPATGIEHLGTAIEREMMNMALILGVDNLLTGQHSGSRALSEDKSKNLYLMVNSCVKDISEAYEKDFVGALWKLNGFPNEMKPSFAPEDVSFKSVVEIATSLQAMAAAGAVMTPDDPAINDMRDLMGIAHAPQTVPDGGIGGLEGR